MQICVKAALAMSCMAAAVTPVEGRRPGVSNGDCQVFRILADGRQVRANPADVAISSRGHASGRSSSVSVRSRSGHSRSSASAFSSSSSTGSRGSARAVSSVTDEDGRTITTTHDEKGCRIVIDDR